MNFQYKGVSVTILGYQGIFPVIWPDAASTLQEARAIPEFASLSYGADVGWNHGFKVKPSEVTQ